MSDLGRSSSLFSSIQSKAEGISALKALVEICCSELECWNVQVSIKAEGVCSCAVEKMRMILKSWNS
jgi:hypothetical protein